MYSQPMYQIGPSSAQWKILRASKAIPRPVPNLGHEMNSPRCPIVPKAPIPTLGREMNSPRFPIVPEVFIPTMGHQMNSPRCPIVPGGPPHVHDIPLQWPYASLESHISVY